MSAGDNKAVILSYASQDAAAVERIAEALRAAGLEVWSDQSELRGGDAWDQKIRRQIRECMFKCNAYLESLHSDPRWGKFLRQLGVADEPLGGP